MSNNPAPNLLTGVPNSSRHLAGSFDNTGINPSLNINYRRKADGGFLKTESPNIAHF